MVRYYMIAEGIVQGVGFRVFVQMEALKLGCTGFVRNLSNGMVEIMAQGTKEDVNQLIKAIKKGNRFIKVEKLTMKTIDLVENEKTFTTK